MRELERKVLVRAFARCYTEEILELHSSQFELKAIGREGNAYLTGFARASGSPETAAFNSIDNAYVAYLGFRLMKINGSFMSPKLAYSKLGVYGGDDGLTADMDAEMYQRASRMVGLVLETECVKRGEMGVSFLARVYSPEVWHGDPSSCCDIRRQISKLHTTVALNSNITPLDKLKEKARSFILTDRNTPVIGEIVCLVEKVTGLAGPTTAAARWGHDCSASNQYPNEDSGWMQQYANDSLDPLGFDWETFRAWVTSASTAAELLAPPLCAEPTHPKTKTTVVLDGDVLEPAKKPDAKKKTKKDMGKQTSAPKKTKPAKSRPSKANRAK
jgi:hypothetical protein